MRTLQERVESESACATELGDFFRRRAGLETAYARELDKLVRTSIQHAQLSEKLRSPLSHFLPIFTPFLILLSLLSPLTFASPPQLSDHPRAHRGVAIPSNAASILFDLERKK